MLTKILKYRFFVCTLYHDSYTFYCSIILVKSKRRVEDEYV